MSKQRPKTQRQISNELRQAHDTTRGLPDSPSAPNFNETGVDFNRGTKQSFRGDNVNPISIGLKDLDEAVFYYFNNVIQPSVVQNGERRNIPIIYGDQERWKSFRRDGVYRDKNGAIMLPIIVIKRDNVIKNRSIGNKLDANQPQLYQTFQKQYSRENSYSNFSALNNRIPTRTMYPVVVPDYVTLEYSCIVQTYYMEQLNKVIEAVEYASDSYWGNPNRFKFRTTIDSFTTATEISQGSDRVVKSTFNLKLNGYLVPDTIQKDLNSVKKYTSKSKLNITSETVYNLDDLD